MREILFRGKRKDNGKWIEGGVCQTEGYTIILTFEDFEGTLYEPPSSELCDIEVIPETVGQFTGLTDKNGKKIFEGDILNTTNSNCAIWYVDYKNTAFCCNQGNANYSCVLEEFMQFSEVEVIGNIHDNPELLKGGEQE